MNPWPPGCGCHTAAYRPVFRLLEPTPRALKMEDRRMSMRELKQFLQHGSAQGNGICGAPSGRFTGNGI